MRKLPNAPKVRAGPEDNPSNTATVSMSNTLRHMQIEKDTNNNGIPDTFFNVDETMEQVWVSDFVTLQLDPSAGATNIVWTVNGSCIDSLTQDGTGFHIQAVPNTELDDASIDFYWGQPGQQSISVAASFGTKRVTIMRDFNVQRPDTTFRIDTAGGGPNNDGVHFYDVGNVPNGFNQNAPLVEFADRSTNPGTDGVTVVIVDPQAGATYGFVQIIDSTSTRAHFTDNRWANRTDYLVRDSTGVVSGVVDSPYQALIAPALAGTNGATVDQYERDETFQVHMLYKHTSSSIYVPLEFASWSWGFTASKTNGQWALDSSHSGSTGTSISFSAYPDWDTLVQPTWEWE